MLVDALQAAVGLQQLRRGLVADAGHAGDVVGGVALEAEEVDELVGAHAVTLEHLGRAVDGHVGDALLRGDDARHVGGQLVGVLVARHQQRLVAQLLVARGDGAQHVVALPALDAHHGHVHGLQQLLDDGELHLEVVVHGRALGLVLLERFHAKRGAARIERADERVGACDVDELEEHGDEAEHGVGGAPVGGVHGLGHGMVGAVHKRVAVDDGDLLRHGLSSVGWCFRGISIAHVTLSAPGLRTMPSRSTVLLAQTAHWAVWLVRNSLGGHRAKPLSCRHLLESIVRAAAAPGGDDLRGGNALMLPWWRRFLLGGLGGWRTARPMRSRGSRRRGRFPGAEPVRGPASRGYGGRGRPPFASRRSSRSPTRGAAARLASTCARGA